MSQPQRETVSFGNPIEDSFGFVQAHRIGDTVYLSGQTAMDRHGVIHGVGDMAAQWRAAYRNIELLLGAFGGGLADLVDETVFTVDSRRAAAEGPAIRKELLGDPPSISSTLIGISQLGRPELLLEIRAVAVLGHGAPRRTVLPEL
jgi:2-iminobutanoate/2-iminopropanoate deaminase